ncbi:hypothetical protein J3965_000548 [Salmonella enterica subsp. enterica serovar Typhimurium]|nr:hypothetical protein [Salmonella enterica subsp. enterica serovar Typhimurium]EHG6276801.1 hypothetical protein [Salmonella enterica subsp. enterica serovar Typhimurium]EHG8027462.1 hypothetical protein [Salmonella enterica subsp. enterica serovar Typhimurium]
MKFDNTWNQGVWFALRSATGRPSPQPFSVEDLPALGEEYRRIMKIISAVYTSKKTLSKRWFASAELLNLYLTAYSALFDHGLASKSDQRFASIRSTGNLTFSTAF